MPADVTAAFKQEKNKNSNAPVHLYTIYDYDGAGTNLYFAESDADVVFDGITYVKFPISFDAIGENNSGEIEKVTLTLSNVSRAIGGYLELYDLRGKKVSIKLAWLDQLDDADNVLEDTFYIDSYSINEQSAVFTLSGKMDVLSVQLPLRRFSRNFCCWAFKSTECGYTGAETTCDKTKQRCKALDNYTRFGGFPSVRSNRIFIG